MKSYDNTIPLLSIHIPKCGGTSLRRVLEEWFGKRCFSHYFDEKANKKPKKYKLRNCLGFNKKNICIHGHFDNNRGMGIEDYYPETKQAIIFIRDPLERTISNFHYAHKLSNEDALYSGGKRKSPPESIDAYIENYRSSIERFLPKKVLTEFLEDGSHENYFVHVGLMEYYQKSIDTLADKLGKHRVKVPHVNKSKRFQLPSESSIKIFKSNCKLEYALYKKGLAVNGIL